VDATAVEKIYLPNEDQTHIAFEEKNLLHLNDIDPFTQKVYVDNFITMYCLRLLYHIQALKMGSVKGLAEFKPTRIVHPSIAASNLPMITSHPPALILARQARHSLLLSRGSSTVQSLHTRRAHFKARQNMAIFF
jgi:hypothetical protein